MNVPLCYVRNLLKNCSADFDQTVHVVWACIEEGFKIGGMSGYSPVCLQWAKRLVAKNVPMSDKMSGFVFTLKMSGFLFTVMSGFVSQSIWLRYLTHVAGLLGEYLINIC